MPLSSVVVLPPDSGLEDLLRLLKTIRSGTGQAQHSSACPGAPADLLVSFCKDAADARSGVPRELGSVPVVALCSAEFDDPVCVGLRIACSYFRDNSVQTKLDTPCYIGQRAAANAGLVDGSRLIGESEPAQEIRSSIQKIAARDTTVLITGETGTGKELIAELIHKNSRRRQNSYLCVNCAAIPDDLLESELFGYERGAFTGAHLSGPGKLEGANGGTVFFDEIGDMSLYAQAKILRLIETREIQRLGAKRPTRVDFRIIAATNQEIDSPCSSSRFRRDLYFRLNVARIHVPALRERKSDIPLLVRHFIEHFNLEFGYQVQGVSEDTMRVLLRYDWPGNIREVKNTVESLFVNHNASERRLELPARMMQQAGSAASAPPTEQERLLSALWATDWNKSKAARQLHWSRMTLYRKMAKYAMTPEARKTLTPEAGKKAPQADTGAKAKSAGAAGSSGNL